MTDQAPPRTPPAGPGGIPATVVETEVPFALDDNRGDTSLPPEPLRSRFRFLERLGDRPQEPGEAAVYRVSDGDGDHVIKWYHRDRAPDPRVAEVLGARRLPHVTHLVETGAVDGHPYEIAPSHGNTDLARYRERHRDPAPPAMLRALVAQLHAALDAVHRLGVVHRDVTPANIVLSTLDLADPGLTLTLVDFSSSAFTTEERPAAAGEPWVGTARYLSPQAVAARQMIHPQADWWSLGMILAELVGGRHPIRHSEPGYVHSEITTRPPDLSLVTDARWRLLCQGLLTRDPRERWGADQVGRWLAGDAPPVAAADWSAPTGSPAGSPAGPAGGVETFPFMGREFTDPVELGMAFDDHWRRMVAALADGRSRRRFAGWLRQFTDAPRYDEAARAELAALIDLLKRRGHRDLRDRGPADTTLVRLLSWLAPPLEPGYRGEPLSPDGDLAELAARAEDGEARALSVVEALAHHPVLPLLDARPGGEGLAATDVAWRAARRRWPAEVAALREEVPALREEGVAARTALTGAEGRRLLAALLRLVAAPERRRAQLDEHASRQLRELPEPVDWYARLVRDRRDPVRLLLAHRLSGLAREEAWRARDERVRRRAERRFWEEQRWAAEWVNARELPVALAWAAAGAAAVTLPWFFLVGLSDVAGWAPQGTVVRAWAWSVPAAAVTFAAELWAAYRIGYLNYRPDYRYHPNHSLAGRIINAGGRAARPVRRHRVLGALAVSAAVGLLLGTLLVAAWLWPAGTVLAVVWWTWYRQRVWSGRRPAPVAPAGGRS
ncbi:protein kinase [Streptomyces sp. B6B3]|uniref:protein kinase domain-containing protein n=1 Tax=Streptomyces sp. B6B3 TaxID=3153570 RepID=UPI00325D8181